MENLERLLKNKYELKRIDCLNWITIIQNILNTPCTTDIQNLSENDFKSFVTNIATNELSNVPKKYKNEFKELIPKITDAFYSFREKIFNGLTVINDNEGVLDIELSWTFTPVFNSNYQKFTTNIGLSNLVESKFIESPEYQKLLEYLKVNDDVAGLLAEMFDDLQNKHHRQSQKTLDIFKEFQKLYNSLTTKQKSLLKDKKIINSKYIDVLEKENKLQKENKELKEINDLINSRYEELKNETDFNKIKKYFEHDLNLVKQNENMYPILFNYFEYIRNEILKANYHKYTNVEVFHYISDITGKRIKPGAIKKYYYDKFKILVRFEK